MPEAYRKIGFSGRRRWYFFYGPLYLAVTCRSCLPEEYRVASFPGEMTMVSILSTLLGLTADTCSASVYGVVWTNFTRFLLESGPRIDSTRRLGWSEEGLFCGILRQFSHTVRLDVSAQFSALDGEEFFVVEDLGWGGRRESDSRVFCRPN